MTSQGPYLFLQGPASPLFSMIAENLTRAGHTCYRINLNFGDQLFWSRGEAVNYRGRPQNWGNFIRKFLKDQDIKTIILFGEERPYHQEAIMAAKAHGIAIVAIEMGYLRPDWVTVEMNGTSSNSHFPNEPGVILSAAALLPEIDRTPRYRQTFLAEALYDLAYYLPSVFFRPLYPHYQRRSLFHPLVEYAGWILQLATKHHRASRAQEMLFALKKAEQPWFVYPLQLETDFQLRAHSPYRSQKQAIAEVLTSFASFAPGNTRLVIKVHPLDNGLISWRQFIDKMSKRLSIGDRVDYFGAGDLAALISGCSGIVTVNSTAALHGISDGIPAKVLGTAIYDVAGMTDQKKLDQFWQDPQKPNKELAAAFYRLLAASIQVRGNLSSKAGSSAAAEGIAVRILDGTVNSPGGDSGHAPRKKPEKHSPRLYLEV